MSPRDAVWVACCGLALSASAGDSGSPREPASGAVGGVVLEYGIVGRMADDPDSLFEVRDGALLHSGDQVRIVTRRMPGTWIYVLLQTADGDYSLLHLSHGEAEGETLEALQWLALDDHTGIETIYLVASATRLVGVENAFEPCGTARGRSDETFGLARFLPPLREPSVPGRELIPLARIGSPSPLAWTYRGPFDERDHSRYVFTRCLGDTIVADRVRIIHE